jgi:hypothetical protein
MVNKASDRSIVIIDEFGKGTLSSDGVGLLSACLQQFCRMRPQPPRVFTSTHFHELLDPAVLPRQASPYIIYITMHSDAGGGAIHADITPLCCACTCLQERSAELLHHGCLILLGPTRTGTGNPLLSGRPLCILVPPCPRPSDVELWIALR